MRPLGPNEGMNALRHPDCRFCDEYERLMRGPTEEVRQLKAKLAESAQANQQLDQLLEAIDDHRRLISRDSEDDVARGDDALPVLDSYLPIDRDLYAAAQKVRAEREQSK